MNLPEGPNDQNKMKQFRAFVKKEFYHVFRDRKTLLLLFGLPIAQIVLFGFALTNEIKNAKIVVNDLSKDHLSIELTNKLEASEYFEIERMTQSPEDMEQSMKEGKVKMAVVFPEQFSDRLEHEHRAEIQLVADASDPNTATTLVNYVSNVIRSYQLENSQLEIPMQIEVRTQMVYNPELKGATNFVPGVMALVLLLVCVLMTSVSIVREKENGTLEVLLVSPFNPLMVILSKAVPYLVLSLVNLAVILILSVTILDMPIKGNLFLLIGISTLFIMTALSLGLLISNVTDSQQTAMLISLMGMLMPTMMFTGFMFPLENMPEVLQWVANIVPSKWYYTMVKAVMIKGLGFSAIWKEFCVLLGMTLLLLLISIRKFKIRLS